MKFLFFRKIRIDSYNCRGLRSDPNLDPCLMELTKGVGIICLQETWLAKQELGRLNSLSDSYHGIGAACVDYEAGLARGRNHGGVAILWHKGLGNHVEKIDIDANWAVGILLRFGSRVLLLLNVYLPYERPDNTDEYLEKVGIIASIIEDYDVSATFIVGDFNADFTKRNSQFTRQLKHFCDDYNLQ